MRRRRKLLQPGTCRLRLVRPVGYRWNGSLVFYCVRPSHDHGGSRIYVDPNGLYAQMTRGAR